MDKAKFNLADWLTATGGKWKVRKRLVCADGFSISVQANETAYCQPRDNHGPWYKVECGFPSDTPELLMEFCEDPERPTSTVYAYVPVDLVEQQLEAHGGVVEAPMGEA